MNPDTPVKLLVVDDSALYRQSIKNLLHDEAGVEIVGFAKNGIDALDKIDQLDPDLLTLDVEMPDMNGIELLREMKRRRMRPKAVMVSSRTSEGASVTTEALLEGAFDFILKPSSSDGDANRRNLHSALLEKIAAFRSSMEPRRSVVSQRSVVDGCSTRPQRSSGGVADIAPAAESECRAVVIGTSTGGPAALKTVLSRLPQNLAAPLIIVQHMPAQYTRSLAERLDSVSELTVVEASDRMPIRPGHAVIAAGSRQMTVTDDGGVLTAHLNDDPPENRVRPSVDYVLRSLTTAVDGDALAVILTGMGRDGLEGCRTLKDAGGFVLAQHQEDCVVYGMPKCVIDAGLADRELPLGKVAPAIVRHIKRSRKA